MKGKKTHKDHELENQETAAQGMATEEKEIVTENQASGSADSAQPNTEGEVKVEVVDPKVQLENQLNEYKDKYLRLSAEFDNYRKRTQREKMDLIKYGSEDVLKNLLPVVDDFERAMKSLDNSTDIDAVKQGLHLIHAKFAEFLKTNGVQEIEATGLELDTDFHEAITKIPAPDEKLKGKIVDVVQKGYKLNDRVIRFSKVVIGE